MDSRPGGPAAETVVRLVDVTLACAVGANDVAIEQFDATAGEVVGIVHPTSLDRGALRRSFLGLSPVSAGRVELFGRMISDLGQATLETVRSRVGWVRDPPLFLNNVPLFENVVLPLRFHTQLPQATLQERGLQLLSRFGTTEIPSLIPLSYGYNRRRIASLARALLPDVALLVIENVERTFLEREYRKAFLETVQEAAERGAAIILMTTPVGRLPHLCHRFLLVTDNGRTAQGDLGMLSGHDSQAIRELADRKSVWLLGSEGTMG